MSIEPTNFNEQGAIKDLIFIRNEISRILGQREENMKFYGMRMSEDEANNLAVQALEQLQKTMNATPPTKKSNRRRNT